MNIEINWDEVDYQVVAITINGKNTLIGWSSVPRWNEDKGAWQASDGRGAIKLHEIPQWAKLTPKESLKLRPAEPRFRGGGTGQTIIDTLSGEDMDVAGLNSTDRRHLIDLLNRVDREGR
jgi:hypothetical protein